jgi:surface antigen
MTPTADEPQASPHHNAGPSFELSPDDRIGHSPSSRLRHRLITGAVVLAVVGPSAWFAWTEPEQARRVVSNMIATAGSMAAAFQPAERPKAPPPERVAEARSAGPEPAALPPLIPAPAASELTTGALAAPAPAAVPAAAVPYEEPAPEKSTPAAERVRQRAIQAGLHPDLSAELFERLSEADYRNAAIAIARALAETPDDGVLVWPTQPKAGQAQFEIKFVPGAEVGCRRYVVAIAKGGWQTTAPALDRCGAKRTAVKRG